MFDPSSATTEPDDDLAGKEAAPPTVDKPTDKTEKATVDKPTDKTEKATEAKKAAKTKSSKRKKDGRLGNWRKYLLPSMKGSSLPDAVQSILEQEPKKNFRIAEVMSALFKEDMPKSQYRKAATASLTSCRGALEKVIGIEAIAAPIASLNDKLACY